MRSKLNYLVGMSLKRKIKTKWFLIANLIIAIAVIGIINIDSIIKLFGGDFDKAQEVYLLTDTKEQRDIFQTQLEIVTKSYDSTKELKELFDVKNYEKKEEEMKTFLEDNQDSLILMLKKDEANVMKATIYSYDYLDTIDAQLLATAINNTKTVIALANTTIPESELRKISAPVNLERKFVSDDKSADKESSELVMGLVFPAFILPFFILTIFLVQMIGAEVNDEKSTRGMEIIISNVSPKTHFFSKAISGNLFVLLQGGLLILFAGIGIGLRYLTGGSNITGGLGSEISGILNQIMSSELGKNLIYIIPFTLALMILTFIAYSLLAGILASMTTNIEDFQQLQTPIMIICMVGYFLATMSGVFEGSIFIRILSYIPFLSAILSPSLLVMGQIGVIDVIISFVLLLLTNWVLVKYGLKIYKVGILNYSSTDLWKKMWKAIKN